MKNLDLQFFADDADSASIDTSVETTETADLSEVEETDIDSTETAESTEDDSATESAEEESPAQTVDVNAIAAAARRKAEAEARDAQARRDAEAVRRFGHLKNPITGEPIRSEDDYWKALDAQEQMQREKALRDKGVDPQIINDLIANNPVVVQASEVIANAQQREAMAQIESDVKALSEFDANIKSFEDVPSNVVQTAIDRGLTLVDAYKIENFGKMTSAKEEAIRQGAINQARNKSHLNPMNGVATKDNSVEIPQSERYLWEEAFPNKSWAERKELYNQTINK